MTSEKFIPQHTLKPLPAGKVSWQAPSNIALVKYWGKYGEQLPKNASVSFTLSHCHTTTTLAFEPKETAEDFDFKVYLEGVRETGFEPKIAQFFKRVAPYVPFLKEYAFTITTSNSFPHSSGIASSASGMSALALCLMEMEKQMQPDITAAYSMQKASFLARLGSGSACRSVEGSLVVWGSHPDIENSTQLFGIPYPYAVHPNFKNYQDTILLVDKGEKQVSSTVGHDLMHDHPFAEQRFTQANTNLEKLIPVFKNGNLDAFIEIVESEALALHAMMMTSMPYFILIKPNTLEIINRIWKFRKATGSHVCFTLDAGANVHVLYPEAEKGKVFDFIKNELIAYCQNEQYICDIVGNGAKKL